MEQSSTTKNAVARAERLMDIWQSRITRVSEGAAPSAGPTEKVNAKKGADGAGSQGAKGRGFLRLAAYGYVTVAAKLQAVVDPVSQAWQLSVQEARQEQKAQVARAKSPAAAKRVASQEKRGEQTLKLSASDAAEAAGTAGDAAAGA